VLTQEGLHEAIGKLWDNGGRPDMISCGSRAYVAIKSWGPGCMKITSDTSPVATETALQYRCAYGVFDVKKCPELPPHEVIISRDIAKGEDTGHHEWPTSP
jgi:hypothetical protein